MLWYNYKSEIKYFILSVPCIQVMWNSFLNSKISSLQQDENVLCRVTADGSSGFKWKQKDINVNTSVTHSWRRLPLVTWLLCRVCGWLGGPSGCAVPVSVLNDELCPRTLDTSSQLIWTHIHACTHAHTHTPYTHRVHRKREWNVDYNKQEMKCLAQGCFDSWGQRKYFSHLYLPKVLRQAIKQLL